MREREISVDINNGTFKFLKYKQYDHNNLLKIIVKEGKEDVVLIGYTARAFFERPDGVILEKNCTIVSNEIKLMITNDVLARKGKVSTEITLSDGNKIVTTFRMYLEVEGSIDRNSAIEEDPEWDLIKDGLGVLDTKANQSDLISLTNRVITNESDIENLENTIDVMYSSVEGSHISTDSSVGYLKDVEILGNTIQSASNLADIRSVGDKIEGQELYEIPVLSRGKNLFNVANLTQFEVQSNNGITASIEDNKIYMQGTVTNTYDFRTVTANYNKVLYDYVNNKPAGTSFTLQNNIGASNYWRVRRGGSVQYFTNIITIQEGDTEIGAFVRMSKGTILPKTLVNIQLEEGTVATPYEPYKEDKLTILSPTQLEKLGNVRDRIIEKDGVWGVEKNIKLININDLSVNNFVTLNKWKERGFRIDFRYTNDIINNASKVSCMFNGILSVANDQLHNSTTFPNVNNGGLTIDRYIRIHLDIPLEYGEVNQTNAIRYLKDLNLTMLVGTTQPQFIPLPHDQQVKLRTFANKTNISFLTEIEGTLVAQVPKSLGATVNTHTEQISNLNKELDRVKKLEESTVSTVETESDFTTVEATSNGYFEDVKLEGKTLVNCIKLNGDWFDTETTLETSSTTVIGLSSYSKSCDLSLLKNNTTYTIIPFIDYTVVTQGTFYLQLNTEINGAQNNLFRIYEDMFNKPTLVTTKELTNKTHKSLFFGGSNCSYKVRSVKFLMLEGDHTQNPPQYFEGLKSVGQDADEIVVSSVNENLVPSDWDYKFQCFGDIKVNQFNTRNFEIVNTNTVDGIVISKNFINKFCHDNKVVFDFYSNQIGVFYLLDYGVSGENYKPIKGAMTIEIGRNVFVIDVSEASGRIAFRFNNNTKNSTLIISDFSIKTSKNSNNVNHQSDKKRLLFYNEETQTWEKPILREWNSIEKHANGKYYYHQRSGEVVLNGSENWTNLVPLSNDCIKFRLNIENVNNTIIGIICNIFKPIDTNLGEGIQIYNNQLLIAIAKSKLSTQDVAGFKAWLQANNVTVVYQLAQEKVYECTNIDLITYANETNYMVESGVIVPKSTLKVLQNATNIIRQLQQKVSVLETDNNRIMQILSDIINN